MLMGALIPYRFNERVENGVQTYDAVVDIFFFRERAYLTGLDRRLKPGKDTVKLGRWLVANGATELHYLRLGEWVKWIYDGKRWSLAS